MSGGSPVAPPPAVQRASSRAMVGVMGLVAAVCGVLIVATYQATLQPIAVNKRIALERTVFRVIPGATRLREFSVGTGGLSGEGQPTAADAIRFQVAYAADGRLLGIAAEGAAAGYADVVRVLYAYDPARQAVIGFGVVGMRETPGIGDKVLTDRAFLDNFRALDVRLAADGRDLAHPLRVVKHGSKRHPWEIDAIAGATVTSKAVGKGIGDSVRRLLPLLAPHIQTLGAAP